MVKEFFERREFYVPRDLVFDAWTDANHLSGWYLPAGATAQHIELNPVVGGTWSVAWTGADGAGFAETGTLEALTRPERIAWRLRVVGPVAPDCDTGLELRLVDLRGACRIELRHQGLADPSWRDRYAQLWPDRLDALLEYFSVI